MPSNRPSLRNLMEDPLFRDYMKKVPHGQPAFNSNPPWRLWVETQSHKWLTRTYADYKEAWSVGLKFYRAGDDITITSRRVFYAPPGEWYKVKVKRARQVPGQPSHDIKWKWRQTFFWPETDLNWCGRCRRPTYWMPLYSTHHALRIMPVATDEDNFRCTVCGIRWIACPDITQMVKAERVPS